MLFNFFNLFKVPWWGSSWRPYASQTVAHADARVRFLCNVSVGKLRMRDDQIVRLATLTLTHFFAMIILSTLKYLLFYFSLLFFLFLEVSCKVGMCKYMCLSLGHLILIALFCNEYNERALLSTYFSLLFFFLFLEVSCTMCKVGMCMCLSLFPHAKIVSSWCVGHLWSSQVEAGQDRSK